MLEDMTNPEMAMALVMEYEHRNGRGPKDVSKLRPARGYDIESEGRCIEVKGTKNARKTLSLYKKLREQLGAKMNKYYIYVVYDIENSPKLKIIEPRVIEESLEIDTRYIIRARSYTRIEPVSDFLSK